MCKLIFQKSPPEIFKLKKKPDISKVHISIIFNIHLCKTDD